MLKTFIKKYLILILLIFIVLFLSVFKFHKINGHSMEPSIKHKSIVMISKIYSVEREDIVSINNSKLQSESKLLKRVIGLPGDKLVFKNDQLFINGQLYHEHYIKDYLNLYNQNKLYDVYAEFSLDWAKSIELYTAFTANDKNLADFEIILQDNEYYLLGDNRIVSKDSRHFGVFKIDDIDGKYIMTIKN